MKAFYQGSAADIPCTGPAPVLARTDLLRQLVPHWERITKGIEVQRAPPYGHSSAPLGAHHKGHRDPVEKPETRGHPSWSKEPEKTWPDFYRSFACLDPGSPVSLPDPSIPQYNPPHKVNPPYSLLLPTGLFFVSLAL
eukprot:7752954-Pyramimonas_sp.AAC.1